jgi:hypothetical protein
VRLIALGSISHLKTFLVAGWSDPGVGHPCQDKVFRASLRPCCSQGEEQNPLAQSAEQVDDQDDHHHRADDA